MIFCSRTHSQLAQFVGEVRRTPFADSLAFVPLASRKQLCVYEPVARLGGAGHMNEACLNLQRQAAAKKKATASDSLGKRKVGACPPWLPCLATVVAMYWVALGGALGLLNPAPSVLC